MSEYESGYDSGYYQALLTMKEKIELMCSKLDTNDCSKELAHQQLTELLEQINIMEAGI